jgi:hypothetical protein
VPPAWIAALGAGALGLLTGSPVRWLLLPAIGGYGTFAALAAARLGGRLLGPRVAAALLAIHAGYGIGMWQGALAAGSRALRNARRRRHTLGSSVSNVEAATQDPSTVDQPHRDA